MQISNYFTSNIALVETHVWATPDVLLLGLQWQFGEWAVPKPEIVVSDDYKSFVVGDKVVLQVIVGNRSVLTKWSKEWLQW